MAQHMLTPPEVAWVDKDKTTRPADGKWHRPKGGFHATLALFTCNGAGTTTTLVGAAAALTTSTNCPRIGEKFVLFNSAGVQKEPTVFTVTAHNGTTTVTFTPAAAAATASGDVARLVSGNVFDDMDSLDAFLVANGYTQTRVDGMTMNDKIYAARLVLDPNQFRQKVKSNE